MPPNMSRSVKFQLDSEHPHAGPEKKPTTTTPAQHVAMHKPNRSNLKALSTSTTTTTMIMKPPNIHHYAPPKKQMIYSSSLAPPGGLEEEDDNTSSFLEETADEVLKGFLSPSSVIRSSESWRSHGKMYRAKLVLMDEEKGGNTFVLSNHCSIERYYRVAERVS